MFRAVLFFLVSFAITSSVIWYAVQQEQQFYPTVVYLMNSRIPRLVIMLQSLEIMVFLVWFVREIVFGPLHDNQMERIAYMFYEGFCALVIYYKKYSNGFAEQCLVLLLLKIVHFLAKDRVHIMQRAGQISRSFHVGTVCLLCTMIILDHLLIISAYKDFILHGPRVELLFFFEYSILLIKALGTAVRYALHAVELLTNTRWRDKPLLLSLLAIVYGFLKIMMYSMFIFVLGSNASFPVYALRPLFFTTLKFIRALSDVILSRRAIRVMNQLCPDATAEELLASDNTCLICWESMTSQAKKLPCGHIFHTICLQSWFMRQPNCPLCRMNILRARVRQLRRQVEQHVREVADPVVPSNDPRLAATVTASALNVPRNTLPQSAASRASWPNNPNRLMPSMMMPPLWNSFAQSAAPRTPWPSAQNSAMSAMRTSPPINLLPPFPLYSPYAMPTPPIPTDLSRFTDAELAELSANIRHNLEQRVQFLLNIRPMLEALNILMRHSQVANSRARLQHPERMTAPSVNDASSTSGAALSSSATEKTIAPVAKLPMDVNQHLTKHNEVTIEDLGAEED